MPDFNISISGKYLDAFDKDYIQTLVTNLASQFLLENQIIDNSLNIKIKSNFGNKTGLGLTEAISAGTTWSLSQYFNSKASKEEILNFILNQKIVDLSSVNLAATIFGGFQLITSENNILNHFRIPCPPGLYFTIFSDINKKILISEKELHNIDSNFLSKTAAFIQGMNSTNLDLIKFSLFDLNNLKNIKLTFPALSNLENINVSRETLGIGMTDNKSTLFFLSANSLNAENIAAEIDIIFQKQKINSITIVSHINHEGVYIC